MARLARAPSLSSSQLWFFCFSSSAIDVFSRLLQRQTAVDRPSVVSVDGEGCMFPVAVWGAMLNQPGAHTGEQASEN